MPQLKGSAAIFTHLDKRGFGTDAIECLGQSLIIPPDILVLEPADSGSSHEPSRKLWA